MTGVLRCLAALLTVALLALGVGACADADPGTVGVDPKSAEIWLYITGVVPRRGDARCRGLGDRYTELDAEIEGYPPDAGLGYEWVACLLRDTTKDAREKYGFRSGAVITVPYIGD